MTHFSNVIKPDRRSLELWIKKCKSQENDLINGKCQLCVDGLLLINPTTVNESDSEQIQLDQKCSLKLYGNDYILQLLKKCVSVKIIYPSNRSFKGSIDLSLFESCTDLELVRVPFNQITGTDIIRRNLCSLVWIRGNYELNNQPLWSSFQNCDSNDENSKLLRIDEIFWDQFGAWPSLTYLCLCRSNIISLNASTIPNSIKTLNVRNNRICQFNNLTNYSFTSSITKLCLDYNSLKELPKLSINTLSSLVYLSLRGNLFENIIGLRNFTSLDYLDLSENCITDAKNFLTEIVYLSSTLKTLIIEMNPICCDNTLQSKCEYLLNKLVKFNHKLISKKLQNLYLETESFVARPSTLQVSNSQALNYEDSMQTIEENKTEMIKKLKSKPSKERFVIVNDEDNKDSNDNNNLSIINVNQKQNEMINYFFGGYTGSYGSSVNNMTNIANETLQSNLTNDDNLPLNENDSNSIKFLVKNQKSTNKIDENEIKTKTTPDQTSEWADEDTDENKMFLVEIYSNMADFEHYHSNNNNNVDYYFVRIRPRDGLIYEKDCTSGKILNTLDLKILQRYEYLTTENFTIRLYFDSCIASKKERIYCFLDQESFDSFVEMFLSKYNEYRIQCYEDKSSYSNNLANKTNNNGNVQNNGNKFISPWFYMCLRCGDRTHRIITNCTKCDSDLIIRDECHKSTIEHSKPSNQSLSTMEQNLSNTINEEIIDNDTLILDVNSFQNNIDHYLKLHIEIYFYEKIADESLKLESVEALIKCSIFDFVKKKFQPGLAVLTANYFLLFNHLVFEKPDEDDVISSKKNFLSTSLSNKKEEKKNIINLLFYAPLATTDISNCSPLIISHLPKPIKNIGYWIEFRLNNLQKKILASKRKKNFAFELVLFSDEIIGKAFLELLFKYQKTCIRKLRNNQITNDDSESLIILKSSLTKLLMDDGDLSLDDPLKLEFDDTCRSLMDELETQVEFLSTSNSDISNELYSIFILESFQFLQNVNVKVANSSMFKNLFQLNENIILVIINDHLIICELYCLFTKITTILKSYHLNEPMANILKNDDKFNDHFKIKTLFNELIINLLPNIYIDKNKFLLVMRFREDDDYNSSIRMNLTGKNSEQKSQDSGNNQAQIIIYEFKLRFLCLNSLMRTCKIICRCWEKNFGVSLTISKYRG